MTNSTFTEGATILTGFHKPLCPSQVTDGSRPLVVKIKQSLGFFFPVSPSNTWKLQSIVALILLMQLVIESCILFLAVLIF